ncbi:hypothetical protein ACPYO6_15455 [Georgenia sp. Z1344]|uniref:hypothetical protein n=1 Tax=Georgenia sp. Z1344 TaxID=3416706 RepID=UPI003CE9E135
MTAPTSAAGTRPGADAGTRTTTGSRTAPRSPHAPEGPEMTTTELDAGPAAMGGTVTTTPDDEATPVRGLTTWRRLRIELRKSVDTVSGAVLTAVTLGAAPLLVVAAIVAEGAAGTTVSFVLGAGSIAAALLLPVLTSLLITSEWGQGSIVSTFAMDHRRGRVMAAKIAAGLVVGLVVALSCLVVAIAVSAVAGVDLGSAGELVCVCAGVTAALLLYAALGSAWGAATLSTPLAIVIGLAGPQVVNSLELMLGDRFAEIAPWLAFSQAVGDLTQGTVASWPHLLTAVGLWIVAPMAVGVWRVRRADVS